MIARAAAARVLAALVLGGTATAHAQDSTTTYRAAVAGRVVAEDDAPVEAADVAIDSTWHTRTDAKGGFRLEGIPVGAHLMEVRAIGFEPLAFDLHVAQAGELGLTVTVKPAPQLLPEMVVAAHQRRLDRVGYYARRATGRGRFLEGDSLRRLDSLHFVWALNQVRGLHTLNPAGLDPRPASTACRGGFVLVVNGWLAPDPAFMLRTLHPTDIDAVEIYEDAGIPNVSAEALQSQPVSIPGTTVPPPSAGSAVSPPPTPSAASAGLAAAATKWLIDRAEGDQSWKKPTPTSCTLVVWERE